MRPHKTDSSGSAVASPANRPCAASARRYCRSDLAGELPTLIVWGEHDPLIPVRHAHEAHANIPGSRLEIFPGAGHFPYRQDPQRFAAILLDFVRTTTPMPVDEQRWCSRLRTGLQSTAAL
jgi:pimeloyl-ACP methyl ester carboxylesterase